MRVRATVRVVGQPVSVESLNVPGQKFEGTVDENLECIRSVLGTDPYRREGPED